MPLLQSEAAAKRLLLISNSTMFDEMYLGHAAGEIDSFLGEIRHLLFIPFALRDHDGYTRQAASRFDAMGRALTSAHHSADPAAAVQRAEAIFVGGGNTFRLLQGLYRWKLLEPIRRRVDEGIPFIGSSAGSIVACPTIRTTKDMPIVEPPSLTALGLVGFQISPHYLDPDPSSRHMGETQEERISQYLEENDEHVVGLREGGMVRVEAGAISLKGRSAARIFRRGHEPVEVSPETRLDLG